MKQKAILVSFIALFAMIFALSTVMASEVDMTVSRLTVIVNDIEASETSPTIAGDVSDTVPIEVKFTADDSFKDVRVRVYIEDYKDEISDSTERFHVVEGSRYIKRFSLKLPSSMDLDDLTEDLSLLVRISAKENDEGDSVKSLEKLYAIKMQRYIYNLNILSIEGPEQVTSGSVIALDVVLENNGNDRLENVYVKASIPELGVEKKVYFGDIEPQDECEEGNGDDCDKEDTVNKKIYLNIPRNSVPGIYNIEVEAYNYDTSVVGKKVVVIGEAETDIWSPVTSKTIAIGEEATFDIPLINYGDRMVVYSLTPEESTGLIIDVEDSIVTIPADSSETVKVKVKATQSAEEGTHLVTVNVNSETGLVKQVNLSVNVEEEGIRKANSVLILTVILAIVFIVLLIILIVLLTKKPTETEELSEGEETSYY